jgi:hypothetical protein
MPGVTLSSNIINSLPVGTYRYSVSQTVIGTGQLSLYNDTDSNVIMTITNFRTAGTVGATPVVVSGIACGAGQFSLSSITNVKIFLYVIAGVATTGFGTAITTGNTEVYGTLELWKIA